MLKILIVDDSLIIRKKITTIVEKLGHKVVGQATTGQEAIDIYENVQPDLVTMDITMPDMNGITAVKHIMKINTNAKIIMVTSLGQEDMVIDSIKAGAIGYMLKPITDEKLAEIIGEVFLEYAYDENEDDLELSDDDL
ncbi:MAG: response regulator [Sulfurimonas sp.]|jgi:two-component system chemotaxis response regulator CheY